MQRFNRIFSKQKFSIIGMLHLNALPGTPKYAGNWSDTIESALNEAAIYSKYNIDALMIENMHDVPYMMHPKIGAEITACMSTLAYALRQALPTSIPLGVQVLACGNKQALAIAKAAGLQFIRSEGFVFGHVADEGYTDACAGELIRYRRQIDADEVLVLTDIKKKHSSHAITQDVNLLETAKAAEFFLTDGIIITGTATGEPVIASDLQELTGKCNTPVLIGSGLTVENLDNYFNYASAAIVGSHFKVNGKWENALSEKRIEKFMRKLSALRQQAT